MRITTLAALAGALLTAALCAGPAQAGSGPGPAQGRFLGSKKETGLRRPNMENRVSPKKSSLHCKNQ